jgi:hypothetical protein
MHRQSKEGQNEVLATRLSLSYSAIMIYEQFLDFVQNRVKVARLYDLGDDRPSHPPGRVG